MVVLKSFILLISLIGTSDAHISHLHRRSLDAHLWSRHAKRNLYAVPDKVPTIRRRAPAAFPLGWNPTSVCMTDSGSSRLLANQLGNSDQMTVDECISMANSMGYTYAGVEYGKECWADNAFGTSGGSGAASTGCTYTCHGDNTQTCGGYNAINVYSRYMDQPPMSSHWSQKPVCVRDAPNRVLPNVLSGGGGSDSMTWETCLALCDAQGYKFCGIEYSRECWGANTLLQNTATGAGEVIDQSNCGMTCTGNSAQSCGGSYTMTMFFQGELPVADGWPAGWDPNQTTRCITDYVDARRVLNYTVGTLSDLTNLGCVKTCASLGFIYAGTENGEECYCGNYLDMLNGGANANNCNSVCTGDSSSICGGFSAITLWQQSMAPISWVSRLPPGWTNSSTCVIDSNNPRALDGSGITIDNMDIDSCIEFCDIMGWSMAGLEWSKECHCGSSYEPGNSNGVQATGCNMACGGNPLQTCGGTNRMTVYTKVVNPVTIPSGWTQKFCAIDTPSSSSTNLLQTAVTPAGGVSAANCINACPSGSTWAGVKNGNECYCGTYLNLAIPSLSEDCSSTCSGDSAHKCGGPARTMLFAQNPPSVPSSQQWTLSQVGNSGIVMTGIAVMDSETVIVFDRKENNPLQDSSGHPAWAAIWNINQYTPRELDIETHSFCSAGSWLSNGTFVNFGGQGTVDRNGETVQQGYLGVRLFNPCGAAGTCQVYEDISRVRMASPRWYPTSVRLYDGSAFLLGGSLATGGWTNTQALAANTYEFYPAKNIGGSNGMPIASQFLIDAMPHNTYPHAFALPNQQIFIAANNLATYLNWQTGVETRLPNLPDGQRVTYPYSGFAVMLPLTPENSYTPEVMICGGSHNSNTVIASQLSAQTSPTSTYCSRLVLSTSGIAAGWQAESMPDPRVLVDGIILPTGKIVIVNGGRTGTASYGNLNWGNGPSNADFPTFTPLLYDPSAPLHQRFSYAGMPTSNIPRLYHATATLLPSGAILLGGSNPNDDFSTFKYQSELRVEYLYPAYMSATRPTYTGLPTLVGYGASFSLTVTLPSGTSSVTVALMDLGWSTHNNHMDQKYVKLVSTLSGNTLTVTGPPNSGVFSPGPGFIWVVADGVPSVGQKTLIGTGADPPFDAAATLNVLNNT